MNQGGTQASVLPAGLFKELLWEITKFSVVWKSWERNGFTSFDQGAWVSLRVAKGNLVSVETEVVEGIPITYRLRAARPP